MFRTIPKPARDRCAVCAKADVALQRCSKCRTVPYCSKDCQRADWKEHKQKCLTFMTDNALNYKASNYGEKAPKGKARHSKRSRGEIISDLGRCANEHNGRVDTYTFVSWQAMNLVQDISKARTHFFAITLKRNLASNDPLTLYSLLDADVLPLSVLEKKFEHWASPDPAIGTSMNPINILRSNERERVRDGGLGAVLVVSVELAEEEEAKPLEQAVMETSCPTFQPLGLFKVHRDMMVQLPPMPKSMWKLCLKNALDGGAYSMSFQPRPSMA